MIKFSCVMFTIICISVLTSGCRNKNLVDKQIMANTYVDILIVKEKFPSNRDSLIENQKRIFEKYGITEKLYEGTLKSYKFNKDTWTNFFKTVYARIDSLKKKKKAK